VCQQSSLATTPLYIFHISQPELLHAVELEVTVYPSLDAEVNATVGKRSDGGGGDGGGGGEGGEGGGGGDTHVLLIVLHELTGPFSPHLNFA